MRDPGAVVKSALDLKLRKVVPLPVSGATCWQLWGTREVDLARFSEGQVANDNKI